MMMELQMGGIINNSASAALFDQGINYINTHGGMPFEIYEALIKSLRG